MHLHRLNKMIENALKCFICLFESIHAQLIQEAWAKVHINQKKKKKFKFQRKNCQYYNKEMREHLEVTVACNYVSFVISDWQNHLQMDRLKNACLFLL